MRDMRCAPFDAFHRARARVPTDTAAARVRARGGRAHTAPAVPRQADDARDKLPAESTPCAAFARAYAMLMRRHASHFIWREYHGRLHRRYA